MGMDVGERYMNHAGAYRNTGSRSENRTEDNQEAQYDLEDVRNLLEKGLKDLPGCDMDMALGMAETYREAHQQALDDIPDYVRLGDIETEISAQDDGYTAVALQYRTGPDTDEWIDEQLQQLG